MKLPRHATLQMLWRVAILLLAIALWIVCILLLLDITRQLLEVLRFIVELGSMQ